MNHECERCGSHSSIFWHTLGYGCTIEGDHAYKVFELCDDCINGLVRYMKEVKENES